MKRDVATILYKTLPSATCNGPSTLRRDKYVPARVHAAYSV